MPETIPTQPKTDPKRENAPIPRMKRPLMIIRIPATRDRAMAVSGRGTPGPVIGVRRYQLDDRFRPPPRRVLAPVDSPRPVTASVGAGGWSYFAGGVPAYVRAFSFVAVNATFYRRVSEARSRLWRRQVPSDFVFSLKVNREVTHRARLHATPAARDAFAHDLRVASALRAPYVVLETPAHAPRRLPPSAERTMEALGVLDVVDLSRGSPRLASDVVYTRLFGKGDHTRYEFDDAELREIDRAGRDAIDGVVAFHGVRMYRDAARFLT